MPAPDGLSKPERSEPYWPPSIGPTSSRLGVSAEAFHDPHKASSLRATVGEQLCIPPSSAAARPSKRQTMFMEPFTASGNPTHAAEPRQPSPSPPNLVASAHKPTPLELDDDNRPRASASEIGMFGDFCLMCGEMIDGQGPAGSVYCSAECEYHQHITSEYDWCDLSLEGYQLPSYGCSTTASLLGAKAVAKRYLEHRPHDQQANADLDADAEVKQEQGEEDGSWRSSLASTLSPAHKHPVAATGAHLKARPALAQLSDLQDFWLPASQAPMPQRSSPPSPLDREHDSPAATLSRSASRRRVSEPLSNPALAPVRTRPPLCHSSFSLTSLSSLSPSRLA
ncbi:hypothetical protein PtA15_7A501 [Puccinia triticina]|uniref:Uncharacterized protein n=1 Tax=Puccinia triticina TaxID=208348 RepID=A0ABY7CVN4_9BASI|nr:uncharacterized protein PtA15_7A501 [Puccinia triticina]WAQ86772.1 hypothetical protein PtA15_7A501 [Puccinia triticina]